MKLHKQPWLSHLRLAVAGLLIWFTAWPVSMPQAQTMYRCGNEFSQTPCAKDATSTTMRSSAAPDSPQSSVMTGDALCLTRAPEAFYLTNPEAVQFVRVSKLPAEVIQYAGTPIAAKTYRMDLYGRIVLCHLSDDETRVLKVGPAPVPARTRSNVQ